MALTDEQKKAYVRELANNPLLEEILTDLRDSCLDNWESTSPNDTDTRESAWRDIQAVNRFRASIKDTLTKLDE